MSQNRTEKLRMLPNDVVDSDSNEAARAVVFTFGAPRAIVIRIGSKDLLGLPAATATKEELKEKLASHVETAAALGIDGDAYRDRQGLVCVGKRVLEDAKRVRLDQLLGDLALAGYKLVNASWFQKPAPFGKRVPDPTLHFTFSLDGAEMPMPDVVKSFLEQMYLDGVHLWCNPKLAADKTPYRLDSLNGFAGQAPVRPEARAARPGVRLRFDAGACGSGGVYDSGYSFDEPASGMSTHQEASSLRVPIGSIIDQKPR